MAVEDLSLEAKAHELIGQLDYGKLAAVDWQDTARADIRRIDRATAMRSSTPFFSMPARRLRCRSTAWPGLILPPSRGRLSRLLSA
jgi:hypothetical protein